MRRRPSSAARRTRAPAARLCAPASLAAHTRVRPPRARASAPGGERRPRSGGHELGGPLPSRATTCPGRPRALGAAGGRGAGRWPPDSPLAWPGRPGSPAPAIAERETVPAGGRASCFPGADCSRLPSGSTSSYPTSFPSPPGGRSGARSFWSAVTRPGKPSWRRKTGQDRGGARQAPETWTPASPLVPAPRLRAHNPGRFPSAAPGARSALQLSEGPRAPDSGDRFWGDGGPFSAAGGARGYGMWGFQIRECLHPPRCKVASCGEQGLGGGGYVSFRFFVVAILFS